MGRLQAKKVLIIDDESQMRHLIGTVLQRAGATTVAAANGADGLRSLYETRPDLVVLDVLMPEMDGWEVLRRIRQMTDIPVIMLTVLSRGQNEVRAFQGGANDYVTKPFDADAFLARAEAVLKRNGVVIGPGVYDDGYLAFDQQRRRVTVAGKQVRLTRKEFALLGLLIRRRGRVCTFESIFRNVWGAVDQSTAENVHVFIWQLRQKIEPDPKQPVYILNQQSIGYCFAC